MKIYINAYLPKHIEIEIPRFCHTNTEHCKSKIILKQNFTKIEYV